MYNKWLVERVNTGDWQNRADSLEILWGPDSEQRYDILFPKRNRFVFSKRPENHGLPVVDRSKEIEEFKKRLSNSDD